MDFLLASGNAHKAEELNELVNKDYICINPAPEKLDVVEDGNTYQENAYLKACAYFEKFKCPVIADDSGLNVEALPNELGVHSARFGGGGLTSDQQCDLLLEKMQGVENRAASFSCVLCVFLSPEEVFFFEGRLKGKIAHSKNGDHGFGYDPVFISQDHESETIAMVPYYKEKNSHRARAMEALNSFFAKKLDNSRH